MRYPLEKYSISSNLSIRVGKVASSLPKKLPENSVYFSVTPHALNTLDVWTDEEIREKMRSIHNKFYISKRWIRLI